MVGTPFRIIWNTANGMGWLHFKNARINLGYTHFRVDDDDNVREGFVAGVQDSLGNGWAPETPFRLV